MFKKSLVFSLAAVFAFSALACSDDDDDKGSSCKVTKEMCASTGKSFDAANCKCTGEANVPISGACDKDSYPGVCSADKKTGYYCGNDGVVVEKKCDKEGYECVATGKNGANCVDKRPKEACTYGTSDPKCSDDKLTLYICGNKNEYYEQACSADKLCTIEPREGTTAYGSCGARTKCTLGDYASTCSADNKVATFCNTDGYVKTQNCSKGDCVRCTDGFVGCGVDCAQDGHDKACTGDKVAEGGEIGTCCDPLTYKAVCSTDKNTVTYCSSVGKVATKVCAGDCAVTSNTNYKCSLPSK